MNTFTLFKSSLFRFSDLRSAKNMPFWKVILYIVFLSVVLAFPITKQMFSVMKDIRNDGQKIAAKLPDFKIDAGKLHTAKNTEGFIYQTNSIIFTFDPEGKRALSDIAADSVGEAVSLGLLKDEFVIVFPNSGVAVSLFDANQFEIPYSKGSLDGLSSQNIKKGLDTASLPFWIRLIVFIFTLYPTFINLIINLLMIAVGANLYSKVRLYKLRFLECLKITTYCATLPVILSSLLHFISRSFDDNFLIVFVSLLIFFFAIRKEKQQEPPLV
ncbi:hypothetical protein DOK67_0001650 [Enterococcus sp. DIV0212c]|uniref:DUF1189 domain-containing protein n=1 Tax=Enterococcus sp. DIV0212c TaxID=2230867 RepID=UPI001A9B2B44|nr:DUF1189 domain-containing protein [Enterococcus sp. DIV0212c]MBO1354145.1 DUF1189 domain-containing protein [Enterococcus sp. DIV0212c]